MGATVVVPPDAFAIEEVLSSMCGTGRSLDGSVETKAVWITVRGGPPDIHDGSPSTELTLVMMDDVAATLRVMLDHDDCPPNG